MTTLSKFKVAKQIGWVVLKRNANLTGVALSAWVIIGSIILARGIRRDRQSATAATTEKLQKIAAEKVKPAKPKIIAAPSSSGSSRFGSIIKIICPSLRSKESWFLIFLSALLIGM
jgi:hypothetical protein